MVEAVAPVKCSSCGLAYHAAMALCPQCKTPNPAPVTDLTVARRIMEAGVAEAQAERHRSRFVRTAGFVAFALSLLTVVPALLVMWVTARRWGRVPFVLIVVDIALLTLATYGTRLFVPVVISAIASLLVFILRYGVSEQGIALGYSSAVILPAMAGGAMVMGSVFTMGVTGSVSANLDRWMPPTHDARTIAGLPIGSVTALRPEEIRWSEAMFCSVDRCAPATEPAPPGASERWVPMDELGMLWLAVPLEASSLSTSVGVVRPSVYTRGRWPEDWRGPDAVSVIAIGLEPPPPAPPLFAGATIGALVALLVGLALVGVALRFAWQET